MITPSSFITVSPVFLALLGQHFESAPGNEQDEYVRPGQCAERAQQIVVAAVSGEPARMGEQHAGVEYAQCKVKHRAAMLQDWADMIDEWTIAQRQ